MKLLAIIGTRPQYIKHSALCAAAISHKGLQVRTVDTGQHYDNNMSGAFVDNMEGLKIHYNIGVGGLARSEQIPKMISKLDPILNKEKPDVVVVYGDTNSTLAGSIVSSFHNVPVAHIEAGLRNYNITVPEEFNRVLCDHSSALLFAPTTNALNNLEKEGLGAKSVVVGDLLVDVIHRAKERATGRPKLGEEEYLFMTLHRPMNTNSKSRLHCVLEAVNRLEKSVYFAAHPRTTGAMREYGLLSSDYPFISFIDPLDYYDTISALNGSSCVITDSGGVQREAYILKRKCITILPVTPWPETLHGNWNSLVFEDMDMLDRVVLSVPEDDEYVYSFGSPGVADRIIQHIKTNIA